jgi:hypothetical protein
MSKSDNGVIIKLDLLRNGLHSLHHGVEHLRQALASERDDDIAAYDPRDGTVTRRMPGGGTGWSLVAYSRPPAIYGIKFAILHLIQAVELLVKAYLARSDNGAIRERPGSDRTISMRTAVTRLANEQPHLLDPEHLDLVMRAADVRNAIEHSAFAYEFARMKEMAIDFLAVSSYLSATLHDINVVDVFQYDPYTDGFGDEIGDTIALLLGERTALSDHVVERHAAEWAAKNPGERLLLCITCGARGGNATTGICVVCGADVDTEFAAVLDELSAAADALDRAKRLANERR